ncbi:hypothetical protein [Microbispora sp. NPDC046933]|uniref:hypothetical protein n=1 Tax=Microbispora sp. NPDC046933 TaxID=3155618 RepID=UPI0033DE041A
MTADHDIDLVPLLGRAWGTASHRDALADLVGLGWTPLGAGDWAIGLRSPGGMLAARVCPFDPAYPAFLELCRRCPGNPYLPRVALTEALDGGGSLTVLEFLAPAEQAEAAQVARRWREGAGDEAFARESSPAEIEALRAAWRAGAAVTS